MSLIVREDDDMKTIFPIMMILGLGAGAGLMVHCTGRRLWIMSLLAASIATVAWGGCIYLLFWLTAPSEMGPSLLLPILLTFLTALVPALLVGYAKRPKDGGGRTREQALAAGHANARR